MGLRFRSLSFLADPAQKLIQVSNRSRQQPKIFDLVQDPRFICGVNLKSKIDSGMWGRCNTVLLIEGCHTSIPH